MDSECSCALSYAGKVIDASPNLADSAVTGSPTRYKEGFGVIRLGLGSVHGRRCPTDTGMVSGVQVPIRWDFSYRRPRSRLARGMGGDMFCLCRRGHDDHGAVVAWLPGAYC